MRQRKGRYPQDAALGVDVWDADHHHSAPIVVVKVHPLAHLAARH